MSHDMTKPYTEEELEGVQAIFRSMPSYTEQILSKDIPKFLKRAGWPNSPAQLQTYVEYWNNFYGGVVPLQHMMRVFRTIHDTMLMVRDRVEACDTDENGYISKEEFELLLSHLVIHEPKMSMTSYENFVKEADTNKDGLVSIEECIAWVGQVLKSV